MSTHTTEWYVCWSFFVWILYVWTDQIVYRVFITIVMTEGLLDGLLLPEVPLPKSHWLANSAQLCPCVSLQWYQLQKCSPLWFRIEAHLTRDALLNQVSNTGGQNITIKVKYIRNFYLYRWTRLPQHDDSLETLCKKKLTQRKHVLNWRVQAKYKRDSQRN